MFEIIRRLDFYLRNEPYRSPDTDENYYEVFSTDDLFDDSRDPARTKVYWMLRRFWVNHWICNWNNVYRKIKYAYQRVVRGWDDRVVWSVDYWLDDKMPAILRKLKEDMHGTPTSMFPEGPEYVDETGNPNEAACKIAEARWDEALDKMAAGFEASWRINDGLYEKELGEYPTMRPKGIDPKAWAKIKDDNLVASRELRKRDEAIFKEGIALFAEHYHSLWD